jgi:TetR/AcrR family transcriptional regulator, copper-responsive repressor
MQVMSERTVGRPRTFDRDEAVLAAARLFWRRGYSGTSTRALSSSLGLSASSIYAAFGSKAGLFEETVRTYAERYREIYRQACEERDISSVLERIFNLSIEEFTQPSDRHPGCLISSAVMTDMPEAVDTHAYATELHASNERALLSRFERAREEGQLAPDLDAAVLAGFVQSIWHGLSARSNQGAGREELLAIARMARDALESRLVPDNVMTQHPHRVG